MLECEAGREGVTGYTGRKGFSDITEELQHRLCFNLRGFTDVWHLEQFEPFDASMFRSSEVFVHFTATDKRS